MSEGALHAGRVAATTGSGAPSRTAGPSDEVLELRAPTGALELLNGLGLDLADALASHLELLAHLFQRVVALFAQAEAHPQHLLLAGREGLEHLPRLLAEAGGDGGIHRALGALVLQKVAEVAVAFVTDRRLQAERLLG